MCCASADGEDLASSLEHVALTSDVVLVPVNNNPFAEEAGGSHWSLLAYQRATHTFVHLDSMSSSGNKSVAATIADHLGALLSGTKSEQRATPGGRAILPRCIVRVPLTACECPLEQRFAKPRARNKRTGTIAACTCCSLPRHWQPVATCLMPLPSRFLNCARMCWRWHRRMRRRRRSSHCGRKRVCAGMRVTRPLFVLPPNMPPVRSTENPSTPGTRKSPHTHRSPGALQAGWVIPASAACRLLEAARLPQQLQQPPTGW